MGCCRSPAFIRRSRPATLSAALVPWMRADRVMALPRGRPVSRATREVVAVLKEVCRDMIRDGVILTAPGAIRTVQRSGCRAI